MQPISTGPCLPEREDQCRAHAINCARSARSDQNHVNRATKKYLTMSRSILLVDDDPDAYATAAKLLWALSYQADVAHDATLALKLVDENS